PQLLEGGLAAEQRDDARVLLSGETLLGGQLRRDGGRAGGHQGPGTTVGSRRPPACRIPSHACTERNSLRPASLPTRRSTACSGWGMRPTTLRPGLQTPAMLASEPLGLTSGTERPARSAYRNTTWPLASSAAIVASSAT